MQADVGLTTQTSHCTLTLSCLDPRVSLLCACMPRRCDVKPYKIMVIGEKTHATLLRYLKARSLNARRSR